MKKKLMREEKKQKKLFFAKNKKCLSDKMKSKSTK